MNYAEKQEAKQPEPAQASSNASDGVAEMPEAADGKADASQSKSGDSSEEATISLGPTFAMYAQRDFNDSRSWEEQRVVAHHTHEGNWVLTENDRKSEATQGRGVMTFVEPAKWTVLSTGRVIWAVRIGQVIATFAPTATAWIQFDPLTVIQQAGTIGLTDDDKEANSITEKMFDNQQKK
jgi:hypothetical protein